MLIFSVGALHSSAIQLRFAGAMRGICNCAFQAYNQLNRPDLTPDRLQISVATL
jgi:hypothetical protein